MVIVIKRLFGMTRAPPPDWPPALIYDMNYDKRRRGMAATAGQPAGRQIQ